MGFRKEFPETPFKEVAGYAEAAWRVEFPGEGEPWDGTGGREDELGRERDAVLRLLLLLRLRLDEEQAEGREACDGEAEDQEDVETVIGDDWEGLVDAFDDLGAEMEGEEERGDEDVH